MEDNIKVLIIGTDINAYYMSRCYHELTGKKADTIGNRAIPYTKISNPIIINNFNEKEIYEFLRNEFELNLEECVFLDDRQENIEAAKAAGIQGIWFQNYRQAKKKLDELLSFQK